VAENAAVGTVVGTFLTTDVDAGDTFTYTLVSGAGATDNASFTILGSQLKTNASFDFETKSSYSVRVRATDAGGLSFESQFTISVTNVNEVPADIALSGGSVNENVAGAAIGVLSVTDPDAGGSHVFSVPGGSPFEVSGTTLKLKAGQSLDFESTPSVTVDVTVTDQGALTRTETFTISVNNGNEPPADIALSGGTVAENAAGAAVGLLSVTDPDTGGSHVFSVPNASAFEVSGTTLKLKAGQALDFETTPSVTVDVTVTDQDGLTRTEALTITVSNVNETPTDIALSGTAVADKTAGAAVGVLSVTDPDAGGSHAFSVPIASPFEVSGTTLKLKSGQALDFDVTPSVTVDVTVTDQGGLARTEAFTITVSNGNDAPTDIALTGGSVAENAAGAVVGTLSVTDPDAPTFTNHVKRVFEAAAPNQTWLTDMTYIPTQEGFLYVAGILDMHSRQIVGLSMDSHMRTELVLRAVDMAAHERRPSSGLILHSDRGSQYTSHAYQDALMECEMVSSMSEVGDCYDNAPMESF
jgi:hypothetical protein